MTQRWFICGALIVALLYTGQLTVLRLFTISALLIVSFLALLYFKQDNILYLPKLHPHFITPESNPPLCRSPAEHQLPFEDVYLTTTDSCRLHCWLIRPNHVNERRQRPTVLFFHANALNMGFRLDNLKQIYNRVPCNILILSYRGYGNSTGIPTEEGLKLDVESAFEYVKKREDLDSDRIVLFGRSLGGACALYLASRHSDGISCTIVENTFSSISSMVDVVFWFISWKPLKKLLLRMEWNSLLAVSSIHHPILFVGGLDDEIVPHSQLKELHRAAIHSRHTELYVVEKGKHNDTHLIGGDEYWKTFQRFIEQHARPKHKATSVKAAAASCLEQAESNSAAVDTAN